MKLSKLNVALKRLSIMAAELRRVVRNWEPVLVDVFAFVALFHELAKHAWR
jgi:hypothetical protein